jgi:hypothetical protein
MREARAHNIYPTECSEGGAEHVYPTECNEGVATPGLLVQTPFRQGKALKGAGGHALILNLNLNLPYSISTTKMPLS